MKIKSSQNYKNVWEWTAFDDSIRSDIPFFHSFAQYALCYLSDITWIWGMLWDCIYLFGLNLYFFKSLYSMVKINLEYFHCITYCMMIIQELDGMS